MTSRGASVAGQGCTRVEAGRGWSDRGHPAGRRRCNTNSLRPHYDPDEVILQPIDEETTWNGGEGGIRTLYRSAGRVTYRFLVAGSAMIAIPAVAHYPKLPKTASVGAALRPEERSFPAQDSFHQRSKPSLTARLLSAQALSRLQAQRIKTNPVAGHKLAQFATQLQKQRRCHAAGKSDTMEDEIRLGSARCHVREPERAHSRSQSGTDCLAATGHFDFSPQRSLPEKVGG